MRCRSARCAIAAIPVQSNKRSTIAPTVRASYAPPLDACTPKAANTRPVATAMKTEQCATAGQDRQQTEGHSDHCQ